MRYYDIFELHQACIVQNNKKDVSPLNNLAAERKDNGNMRFLLYNISYGAGTGYRLHLPFPYAGHLKRSHNHMKRITSFIKSMNPDIVGLIEVDSGSIRCKNGSQAEAIAQALNHHPVFESKYADRSIVQKLPIVNKQGNALLINQEIETKRFHYFSNGVKRLVIEVRLRDVVIFLVHLSLKFRHRQQQLTELYSLIKDAEKPVIVAGDFNTFQGEQELALFMAASGLTTANGRGKPSYPSRSPRHQLDFICHSPAIRTKGFEIPAVNLSDHAPIIWDFAIEN